MTALGVSIARAYPLALDWLLLGVEVDAPDELARALLLPVALLWLTAGSFARTFIASRPVSFWCAFLVTCAGNLGALLARDVVTFYASYAVMTFAAYGLILHDRTEEARRAGRVYVAMAFAGEMALLAAFWMIVGERVDAPLAEAPLAVARGAHPALTVALLLLGFGVKAGIVPLHVWLPLAHPVAPAPASAILSGALIKAGLFGWLRFLPLGHVALPAHGAAMMALGAAAITYAAIVGALQREPKTILAYSSVSQMGFMLVPVGVALAEPSAARGAIAAALSFAQQHVLVKGALFLGVAVAAESAGPRARRWALGGLLLSALALAGAPLTSGALAKLAVKQVTDVTSYAASLDAALSIGSAGSALLMARFLAGVFASMKDAKVASPRRGLWGPWALLVGAAIAFPAYAWSRDGRAGALLEWRNLWTAAWPLAVGVALFAASRVAAGWGLAAPSIPAGDVLVPIERCARDRKSVV